MLNSPFCVRFDRCKKNIWKSFDKHEIINYLGAALVIWFDPSGLQLPRSINKYNFVIVEN